MSAHGEIEGTTEEEQVIGVINHPVWEGGREGGKGMIKGRKDYPMRKE